MRKKAIVLPAEFIFQLLKSERIVIYNNGMQYEIVSNLLLPEDVKMCGTRSLYNGDVEVFIKSNSFDNVEHLLNIPQLFIEYETKVLSQDGD